MMDGKNQHFSSLMEIPRFHREESLEIEQTFIENQIYYEKHAVQLSADPTGGYHEYIFSVPKEQFSAAIKLLKEYYGIKDGFGVSFTGTCPACGANAVNVTECIDCGLVLGGDNTKALQDHPFVIFLKDAKILEQSKQDSSSSFDSSLFRIEQKSDEKFRNEKHPNQIVLRVGYGILSLIFGGVLAVVSYSIVTEWQTFELLGLFFTLILIILFIPITFGFLRKTFGRYDKDISF